MQTLSESMDLPVAPETAFAVLSNLSMVFRLSPFWSLRELKYLSEGDLQKGSRFEVSFEYYGKELVEKHVVEILELLQNERITLKLEDSLLQEISFDITPNKGGILLTGQFLHGFLEEAILKGTRDELHYWLRSIGEYLKLAGGRSAWSRIFRCFMDAVWLKLNLSERKIAVIMIKISLLELGLLIVMALVWNIIMV